MKIASILCLLIQCFAAQVCAQTFKEVSNQLGLNYIYPGNDNQEVGSGVVVLDVNNDGWDDFFQAGGVFPSKLWINKKGKFADATADYKLQTLNSLYIQGGAAADFNNDGFEDLFICNFGKGMRHGDDQNPVLLMNVGGKYFQPVFTDVFNSPGNYTSCTWGDYDNDGFVDLYVTDYVAIMNNPTDSNGRAIGYNPTCNENKLYKNLGGKGFKEVGAALGLNDQGCGLACSFTDYDNDGDVDLLLLNDFGQWTHLGNLFFRNDFPEKKFTEISKINGFYNEMFGMGIGAGDVDNDGDLDYYITNIGQNFLYQNNKEGFTDMALQLKVDNTWVTDSLRGTAWSGLFLDVDNNGFQDLYVSKGNLNNLTPKVVIKDPNKLFLNLGHNKFTDVSATSGVADVLSHRGAALLDVDHDGDVDIISSVIKMQWSDFGNLDQKLKLFRNDHKNNNQWIGFRLTGTGSINSSALGASVTIQAGGLLQIKEVDGGSGHGSQSSKTIYFGIGNNKRAEAVSIRWPGGKTIKLQNVKAGKLYAIDSDGRIRKGD